MDIRTRNGNWVGQRIVVALDIPVRADSVDQDSFVTEATHSSEGALERRRRRVAEVGFNEFVRLTTHVRVHLEHFAPLSVFADVVETRGF